MREDVERQMKNFARGTGAISGGADAPNDSGLAGAFSRRRSTPGQELEERVPFKGLRKKISEKMRQSKDHAAHFTYVEEADASELVKLRSQAKEIGAAQGVKVTFLPFIMKAMVAALRKYPILNSSYDEAAQELVYKKYYNISLSIQTDDGLMAPVVKGVDHKVDSRDRAGHPRTSSSALAPRSSPTTTSTAARSA